MLATKINLSQMVDLAVGTPEVGAVNCNVLHTLLHAILSQLNIVDVQADINDFDRDFLSASKARELSVLSVDSGQGEDARSERPSSTIPAPSPSTGKRTPSQLAKIQEELKRITTIPSNKHHFKKSRTKYEEKPNGEMWLNMQLMNRVDTHEKEMAKLNIDLMKRLNAMEKSMNEMNDKYKTLPSADDFGKFVTRAKLEDALQGIRQDCGDLQQPTERVVIEMSSLTDPVISEPLELLASPPSARSVTSNEDLLQHKQEMQATGITNLQMRVCMLEDQLNLIQDTIELDSTRWEISRGTLYEEEISNIFTQNESDKTKNLAYVVNDQLHDIRDAIKTVDNKLKKKAKVEISLERTKSADFYDTDHDALLKSQNANREEIKELFVYCNELKLNKADRTEVRRKADKMALVAVSSLIDRKTNHILNKMAVNEDNWNEQCQIFSDDINEKIDREELEPLKEALNNKLKKQNQAPVEWVDDDAAGIKRPVLPSVSCHQALPPTRSPRPHLNFEMDQIQQHAKSDTSTCIGNGRSRSSTVAEREKSKMPESDQKAFQVYFGNDVEAIQKQRNASNTYANADNDATNRTCGGKHTTTKPHKRFTTLSSLSNTIIKEDEETNIYPLFNYANADNDATNRSCGGKHTTTKPHNRLTMLSSLSNTIIKEDEETNIYPLYKEVDVQGADGNIYKGRMDRVEAKLPSVTQATKDPSSMQRKDKRPQQMRRKVMRKAKPSSNKILHAPRPPPKNGSRPH